MKRSAPGTFPTFRQATKKMYKRSDKSPKRRPSRLALKPEAKAFDTALAFNIDQTGEVPVTGQLALITQGDTNANRDGNTIRLSSIQLRAVLTLTPGAVATTSPTCAIYIVQDKQPNGAAATVSGDANSVFTGTNLPVALRDMGNAKRFVVLKKFLISMAPAAGVTTAFNTSTRYIDYYGAHSIEIQYGANAGAITDLRGNNIFLMAGSDSSDDLVTVVGNCRLRFVG